MRIHEILWPEDRIEHILHHRIDPVEVEEVCFGLSLIFKGKSSGPNPLYYVLGQTTSGRHLFCVIIQFPDGKGYPVTAREMTQKEKKRYALWRKK